MPSWEKKFCASVGSVPWRKLLETKRYLYLYDNVIKWNDSAVEEAFNNAKNRFWAQMNGFPCNISLPDPNIYIDDVDWNSSVDPELLLDLEREPNSPSMDNENVVVFDGLLIPNQPLMCTGWGDAEEDFQKVTELSVHPRYGGDSNWNVYSHDGKNPWEDNCAHDNTNEVIKDDGWNFGWGECEKNFNDTERDCQPTWGGANSYSWKKDGGDMYDSRYKTSRFHGDADRGGWRDRGGRRKMANFAYEKPALRQWTMKSCGPVRHHESDGKRGNNGVGRSHSREGSARVIMNY